jgi:murein DD-endopeptidase MepM/ murein hydrolase activator NlpD
MKEKARQTLRRMFPERQIFYRSRGHVRFVRLPRSAQLALIAVIFSITGWVGYTSATIIFKNQILAAKDQRIENMKREYDTLASNMAAVENRFTSVTGDLENKHRQLQQLLEQRNLLKKKVSSLEQNLAEAKSQHDSVKDAKVAAMGRLEKLEAQLKAAEQKADKLSGKLALVGQDLTKTVKDRDEARKRQHAQSEQLANLERELKAVRDHENDLQIQLAESNDQLKSATEERDSSNREKVVLSHRIAELKEKLKTSGERTAMLNDEVAALNKRVESVTKERDAVHDQSTSLNKKIANLIDNLSDTSVQKKQIEDTLIAARTELDGAMHERDSAKRRNEYLKGRVSDLENRLVAIRSAQQDLIDRVHTQTKRNIAQLEQAIARTGVNLEQLVEAAEDVPNGQGGPMITLGAKEPSDLLMGMDDGFEDSLERLEIHLARWGGLQQLLKHIPLSRPVDNGYVSSSYGKRRDPMTKRWAMHHGVDYAGFKNMPILATAPGRITFAGRNGAYGRMVEVDHGFGFKTRYGHMRKITVKKGQKVSYRTKIGLMGSTGRSTGPHVHYEILYQGVAKNPANFIEAGKHVFKE